jgi:hypothetical protein
MFPLYRKYKNNKNYFKVISENEFEELSIIGTKLIINSHQAKILPDRNFIFDLIENSDSLFLNSSEEEYNTILKRKDYEHK